MKTTIAHDYITCPKCEGEREVYSHTTYGASCDPFRTCDCGTFEHKKECPFCDGEGSIPVPKGTLPHEDVLSESKHWEELLHKMEDWGGETHSDGCDCEDSLCLSLRCA